MAKIFAKAVLYNLKNRTKWLSYYCTRKKILRLLAAAIMTYIVVSVTFHHISYHMDDIYEYFNSKKELEDFIFDKFNKTRNRNVRVLSLRDFKPLSAADVKPSTLPKCPEIPPKLQGYLDRQFYLDFLPLKFEEIEKQNPKLKKGGRFAPEDCIARSKVAIIIPLRGRLRQLQLLLAHMHPIWQRQQMDYTVYVIWQDGNGIFNKAKLMNGGVLEVLKERNFDCFVFHDADMLLEDDRCLYWCPSKENTIREISVLVDKFYHRSKYYRGLCNPSKFGGSVQYFGGVCMVTKKQMFDINGYSNIYWGWGGEDDDMYIRLWSKGYQMLNPYGSNCSFHMLKHKTETSNVKNEGRHALLTHTIARMKYDGLNTLRYKVISKKEEPLFTNITLDVGQPTSDLTDFMAQDINLGLGYRLCHRKVPWYFRKRAPPE